MKMSYLNKFKQTKTLSDPNGNNIVNQFTKNHTSKSENDLLKRPNQFINFPTNLSARLNSRTVRIIPSTGNLNGLNPKTPTIIVNYPHYNGNINYAKILPNMKQKVIKIVRQNQLKNQIQSANFEPITRNPSPKILMINRENQVEMEKYIKNSSREESIKDDIGNNFVQTKKNIVEDLNETVPSIYRRNSSNIDTEKNPELNFYQKQKSPIIIIKRDEKKDNKIQPVDHSKKLWYTKSQLDLKKEPSDLNDNEQNFLINNHNQVVKLNSISLTLKTKFYI
jgi:hypothetical protein